MKINHLSLCIFILLIYSINCAYKIWDKEEFYKQQKEVKKGLKYYNQVLDDLKTILEYYVYIDLLKNPPQPSDLPNYNPKVDTMKKIEEIRSSINEETNYYDFFRKIRLLIDSYKDAHMSYGLKGYTFDYVFLSPIKLITVEQKDGTPYMTASANIDETYFKNGTEVFKIINKNEGEAISKINGLSPFEFMQNFGGKFFNLKNPQANYAFKTHNYLTPFFAYFPFDEDEIELKVEYKNGEHFESEYAIAERVNNKHNLYVEKNLYNFFGDINIENEFMNYLDNYFENNNFGVPKGLNELLNDFQKMKNINDNNLFIKNKNEFNYENLLTESEKDFSKISWDIEYDTGNSRSFQCRVDGQNQLNVIHMPTFDFNNLTLIIEKIKECVESFDTNNNKIVVILDFNGGGIELVAQTLVEYIQPFITSRFYSTFRKGKYLDRYYDMVFEDHSVVDTCKVPDKNYILNNTIHIDYGKGVINNVTEPLRRFGQYSKEFNEEKKSLKNKRKPTEIIIFTDGYSASSASLFTKSLQNEGGAIIVGYNGNPVSGDIFDGSQHFSSVFNFNALKSLENELMQRMIENKIYFSQICKTSNFFDYRDPKVPEEFNIKEVDEIANIYESFDENKNYQLFMDKAKEIFANYNTNNKCNRKNKRMTLLDDNCSFDDDQLSHGGHPCNEEGLWDQNSCIKVYCDEGYLLDYKENKCVKDPCLDQKENPEEEEETEEKKEKEEEEESEETDSTDNTNNIKINIMFILILLNMFL